MQAVAVAANFFMVSLHFCNTFLVDVHPVGFVPRVIKFFFYYLKRSMQAVAVAANFFMVSLHFCNTFLVDVHPVGFVPRFFKFFFYFQMLLSTSENLYIITLILIVLNYSCWINVTKARPLPDCFSFTSMGEFYEHFCSLHILLLPKAQHASRCSSG